MRIPATLKLIGLIGLMVGVAPCIAIAKQFELNFDGPETSWQVRSRPRETRLEVHERRIEGARRGHAEFFRIRSTADHSPLRLEQAVPAVQVLDELTASVWIKADRPGAILAVRISFRDVKDPATGAPLTTMIVGERYEEAGKWQQLKCRTTDRAVNDQLRRLRATRKLPLDAAVMYVDRVVVENQLSIGVVEMQIDDLELVPIVPVDFETEGPVEREQAIATPTESRVDSVGMPVAPTGAVPVEFRLHKLRVEGKPFFPRVIPLRQERAESFVDAGINVVWGDVEAISNTGQYRDRGIWLASTPPFAKSTDGQALDSDDASLLPFAPSTSSVLFWMLGVRMTPDHRPRLPSWANQIRDADRAFKRPLAADIADDERVASRHLDLVGLSRHVVNSDVSFVAFRDDLIRRRDRAWPGTFCFSWLQTEPASELMNLKQICDETPVIEPEQIRLQAYAALAAGCRGLGYWTTTSLDSDAPGSRERFLMLTQLNLELGLLEPWLATGAGVQQISFTVDVNGKGTGKSAKKNAEADKRRERELSAAMIRTDLGMLLLPMWLEEQSQFVPAGLAAQTATIVVPGGGETATAWQVTTTGRVLNLNRETIAGGIRLVIPKFDQTAAVLITTDPSIVDQINQRISQIQERSATVMVELCRLKLERTRKIDEQLQQLGVGIADSRQLLGQAKLQSDMAEARLKQQDYHSARQYSTVAMQLTRLLQRAHWDQAVAKLPSPTTSPYTLCFQTLPAHWRLFRSLQKQSKSSESNRLPSGEFEDLDTLIASGWRHAQHSTPDVQSIAELHESAKQGKYSLRLAAEPTVQKPTTFQFHLAPVAVTSPAVTIHAGHVVKISGWAKVPYPIVRSTDGALIYDSVLGKTGALRLKSSDDWQRFEFWRVAPESGLVTVTAEMKGLGEIWLDDMRITSSPISMDVAAGTQSVESDVKPARFTPLDPFDLRRFTRPRSTDK